MAYAHVVRAVAEYLAETNVPVTVLLGLREEPRQIDGPETIIFSPTSLPVLPPTEVGEVPITHETDPSNLPLVARALFDTAVTYDVRFIAHDAERSEDDEAHMWRAFWLFERTAQAVQRAYAGVATWGPSGTWPRRSRELRRGIELRVPLALTMPIFDRYRVIGAANPVPGAPKPVPIPTP